ncbi:hypothetical protein BpHYR1_001467 [Brachionus plicatilis]|uniref:Uncharacterized protein n=1 Tax=Brachionus plicatilis TaxID=10195 RepID=A0A3M7PSW3_BRAPC|nr:hypothetical protein BpHYR1_001467 [Brachionus plicatilis]
MENEGFYISAEKENITSVYINCKHIFGNNDPKNWRTNIVLFMGLKLALNRTIEKIQLKLINCKSLETKTWTNFDKMMREIYDICINVINLESWKFSKCTCKFWMKNYYFDHVIGCCYRLKLMNLDSIGMDIPISNKRKRGAQSKNKKALEHQPTDLVNTGVAGIESDELSSDQQSKRLNVISQPINMNEVLPSTSNNIVEKFSYNWGSKMLKK